MFDSVMELPSPETALRDAIRHWSRLPELAEFAIQRHGFGNTDCGFGVTYPGDLDEHERAIGAIDIPEGFVQVYGFWGLPDGYEFVVSESAYLTTLAEMLAVEGYPAEAQLVSKLLGK